MESSMYFSWHDLEMVCYFLLPSLDYNRDIPCVSHLPGCLCIVFKMLNFIVIKCKPIKSNKDWSSSTWTKTEKVTICSLYKIQRGGYSESDSSSLILHNLKMQLWLLQEAEILNQKECYRLRLANSLSVNKGRVQRRTCLLPAGQEFTFHFFLLGQRDGTEQNLDPPPISSCIALCFFLHSSSLFLQAEDIKSYKSNMGKLWVGMEDFILPYSAADENSEGPNFSVPNQGLNISSNRHSIVMTH